MEKDWYAELVGKKPREIMAFKWVQKIVRDGTVFYSPAVAKYDGDEWTAGVWYRAKKAKKSIAAGEVVPGLYTSGFHAYLSIQAADNDWCRENSEVLVEVYLSDLRAVELSRNTQVLAGRMQILREVSL